jgi:hypothetical protein
MKRTELLLQPSYQPRIEKQKDVFDLLSPPEKDGNKTAFLNSIRFPMAATSRNSIWRMLDKLSFLTDKTHGTVFSNRISALKLISKKMC